MNAFLKFLLREFILVIHGYDQHVKIRFAFIRTVEINFDKIDLCLQLKRSGTEYAAKKINFSTSAVANDQPLSL